MVSRPALIAGLLDLRAGHIGGAVRKHDHVRLRRIHQQRGDVHDLPQPVSRLADPPAAGARGTAARTPAGSVPWITKSRTWRPQVFPVEAERAHLHPPAGRILHRLDDLVSHEIAEPGGLHHDDAAHDHNEQTSAASRRARSRRSCGRGSLEGLLEIDHARCGRAPPQPGLHLVVHIIRVRGRFARCAPLARRAREAPRARSGRAFRPLGRAFRGCRSSCDRRPVGGRPVRPEALLGETQRRQLPQKALLQLFFGEPVARPAPRGTRRRSDNAAS